MDLGTCAHHDHNQDQGTCVLVDHDLGEGGVVVDRDLEETDVWDVENILVGNDALVVHDLWMVRVLETFLVEDHNLLAVDLALDWVIFGDLGLVCSYCCEASSFYQVTSSCVLGVT